MKDKLASKSEDELRRLSVEMRLLDQSAEIIQSRVNTVNALITDLTYAGMALEGLKQENEGSELFVPIGGNSYIRAKLQGSDKVVVGMGAGVAVEKTLPEAEEIIKKRVENMQKTRMSLQQQFTQVAQKMSEDRVKFEELAAEMRQEKAP